MEFGSHFLFPSAIFAEKDAYKITTILGSCIAVCLYDPVLKTGGMNHYMLPLWNGQGLASPKYGNVAIDKLIDRMLMLVSSRNNLKAKVFGGGDVLIMRYPETSVGKRNIDLVFNVLNEKKIQIIASSVGGNYGRRIIFNTYNGEVLHQFLQNKNIINP